MYFVTGLYALAGFSENIAFNDIFHENKSFSLVNPNRCPRGTQNRTAGGLWSYIRLFI